MKLLKIGFPAFAPTLAPVFAFVAAAFAGSAVLHPALADSACRAAPGAATMSAAAVRDKVTGLGYEVWRVELDDGCYEIEARDSNGAYVELDLDPATGDLLGWERED
jgi:hypothetical protein